MARNIFVGIGAFALVTMGTVSTDPSNRDVALSSLSIGGTAAFAQIPDALEALDDLGVFDDDDDDGPGDDDAPGDDDDDNDDDTAAAAAPRKSRAAAAPRRSAGGKSACEERARHEDRGRYFAGSPCWAREAFGSGSRRQ